MTTDVQLTEAELDEARAEMAHFDDESGRRAHAFGAMQRTIELAVLGELYDPKAGFRWALAMAAVADEIPDRRTVLAAKLAMAERYIANDADFWAPYAERYRAELAALDAEQAGTAARA